MSFGRKVRLPDGGEMGIADNQTPYHLNCPIDGTQLAERAEYDTTGYDCVTCKTSYSVRRGKINEEELGRQAREKLKSLEEEADELHERRAGLLNILKLAEKNNFEY